jgi:hypothetical protein
MNRRKCITKRKDLVRMVVGKDIFIDQIMEFDGNIYGRNIS